jgi:para-nitrobenzyl esterase
MRKFAALAALAITLAMSPAIAEAPVQTHYSAASTPIGTLLADPAARAAIGRRFPMLLQSKAVTSGMANRMTLRSLKHFKPAIFTDAALAAIDADFAHMPGR